MTTKKLEELTNTDRYDAAQRIDALEEALDFDLDMSIKALAFIVKGFCADPDGCKLTDFADALWAIDELVEERYKVADKLFEQVYLCDAVQAVTQYSVPVKQSTENTQSAKSPQCENG